MLDALTFVKGAVSKKDFVPVLTHFRLNNGKVTGYNGTLALQSPIPVDINALPHAIPLIKAIQGCSGSVALTLTEKGKIIVKDEIGYKVYVDCTTDDFPDIKPEGKIIPLDMPILKYLKNLAPFISKDASRQWSQGILFKGRSAYVTNNIILIEQWLGSVFPQEIIIPEQAVRELIRIGKEPVSIQLSDRSCTFHFEGGQWLRTQLVDGKFPDLGKLFDSINNPIPIGVKFFDCLEKLVPFMDKQQRVFFQEDTMSTHLHRESGCHIKIQGYPNINKSCFNIKHLLSLKNIINSLELNAYPKPCGFYGNKLRGVIIGMVILNEVSDG